VRTVRGPEEDAEVVVDLKSLETIVSSDFMLTHTAIGQVLGTRRTFCFYFSRTHVINKYGVIKKDCLSW
jgi:hypothetical protein